MMMMMGIIKNEKHTLLLVEFPFLEERMKLMVGKDTNKRNGW